MHGNVLTPQKNFCKCSNGFIKSAHCFLKKLKQLCPKRKTKITEFLNIVSPKTVSVTQVKKDMKTIKADMKKTNRLQGKEPGAHDLSALDEKLTTKNKKRV